MNIVDKTGPSTVPFKNLKAGDVFRYKGNSQYFMKITSVNVDVSWLDEEFPDLVRRDAVCLADGTLVSIGAEQQVVALDCDCVIK